MAKMFSSFALNRKNILFTLLMTVILAYCVYWGIGAYVHFRIYETTDNAYTEGHVINISPRVAGFVTAVHVDDNQRVKAGDLLVELSPDDFNAQLKIAESELAYAEAQMKLSAEECKEYEAKLSSAKNGLSQVKFDIEAAQATSQQNQNEYKRAERLVSNSSISKQTYEKALAAKQISDAGLQSVEKKTKMREEAVKQAEINLRQAHITNNEVARADVEKARAQVQQAALNLSYTKIYAPADGYVTKKTAEPGSYVQIGQNLMAVVPRDVWVVANFKETQIAKIKPGSLAYVTVDAYPAVRLRGRVDSIQRGTGSRFTLLPPENATGNFIKVVQRTPVKIVLDDDEALRSCFLVPGMSVIADVETAAAASAVLNVPGNDSSVGTLKLKKDKAVPQAK